MLLRDRADDIWVGTNRGVAKLVPKIDPGAARPRVYLTGVRVEGTARSMIGPLRMESDERTVDFAFAAPSFRAGETMRFQWRLHGVSDVWSSPGTARAITCAGLSPGPYRFEVRALDGNGLLSEPASLDIAIAAPVWQRGWFVVLAALVVCGIALSAYRIRVGRLLAVERMRTRIASDLHDALGADLSRISLLADFAQHDVDSQPARARTMLSEVAHTAREAVREMSDIVWALQSKPADVSQIVGRLRDFAADLARPLGIALRVTVDPEIERLRLPDDRRRELYLLLKEAVINAIRHAGARVLVLDVRPEGADLVAEVVDDGRGFALDSAPSGPGGNGIASMRARAARLGARLSIDSAAGRGTTVRVTLERT
jgi:signal transduction histidine kinase